MVANILVCLLKTFVIKYETQFRFDNSYLTLHIQLLGSITVAETEDRYKYEGVGVGVSKLVTVISPWILIPVDHHPPEE